MKYVLKLHSLFLLRARVAKQYALILYLGTADMKSALVIVVSRKE